MKSADVSQGFLERSSAFFITLQEGLLSGWLDAM
jgi:hypothetical protein